MFDFNEWRLNEATQDIVTRYRFGYKSHLAKDSELLLTYYSNGRFGSILDGHVISGATCSANTEREVMGMSRIFEPTRNYLTLKCMIRDGATQAEVLMYLKNNTIRSSNWTSSPT